VPKSKANPSDSKRLRADAKVLLTIIDKEETINMEDTASNSDEDLDIDAFFLPGGILSGDDDPQHAAAALLLTNNNIKKDNIISTTTIADAEQQQPQSSYGSADLASSLTSMLRTATPPGLHHQQQQHAHQHSSPVPVNPWDETAAAATNHGSIRDFSITEAQLMPDDANHMDGAVEGDDISSWLQSSMSSGLEEISRHSNSNQATGLELQVDHFSNHSSSNHHASGSSWATATALAPPPGLAPPLAPVSSTPPPPGFERVVVMERLLNESSSSFAGIPSLIASAEPAGTERFGKGRVNDDAAKALGGLYNNMPKTDPPPDDPTTSKLVMGIQPSAFDNKRTENPSESVLSTSQDQQASGLSGGTGKTADATAKNGESSVDRAQKPLAESNHSSNSKNSSSKRNKKKNKHSSSTPTTEQPLLDSATNSSEFHAGHPTDSPTTSSSLDHHTKGLVTPETTPVEESLLQVIFNVFAAILAGIFQTSPAAALAWVVQLYKAQIDPMVQSIVGTVVLLVKYVVICCFALGNVFKYAFEEAALDYHFSRLMNPTRQSHHERQTVSILCYMVMYLFPFLSDILMSNMDCPHYTPHIISNVSLYALSLRLSRLSSVDYASGASAKRGKLSINDNNGITSASYKASTYIPDSDRRQLEYRILRSLRYAIPCSFVLEGFSAANASFAMADAPVRLVLAYLLSLVRHGLLLSPVAWIGWSTQILLATYLPGGILLDLFLVVVGLAFIRLVSTLHNEQGRF